MTVTWESTRKRLDIILLATADDGSVVGEIAEWSYGGKNEVPRYRAEPLGRAAAKRRPLILDTLDEAKAYIIESAAAAS